MLGYSYFLQSDKMTAMPNDIRARIASNEPATSDKLASNAIVSVAPNAKSAIETKESRAIII